MSKYGHFSEDGSEYIITRPDTPKPWINYLTNGRHCALISQTGGGYSFVGDAGYNRILEEHPSEELISDRPGRYIYIRDNKTKEFWTINWQPVQKDYQFYECRLSPGYTIINSKTNDIEGKITYFVPLKDDLEIWKTKIINHSNRKRDLTIFVYVEWSLGNHLANLAEASFNDLFNDIDFKDHVIFATKRRWERPDILGIPWDKYAFLTANLTFDSFDCFKDVFVGMYGGIHNPKAVREGHCFRSHGDGHHSIGAISKRITLTPNQSFKFNVLLGTALKKDYHRVSHHLAGTENAEKLIMEYKPYQKVDQEFERMKKFWKNYNNHVHLETPDRNFNLAHNYWTKYQSWMTVQWSLMDSYYVGGGATYGFRDMSQHILGTLPNDPEFSKERIKLLCSFQFSEGKTVHNWDALLKKGLVTDHSDDPYWLMLIIIHYLYETGDLAFLEENIPFYDTGEATVKEHLIRALEYSLRHLSPRGIPLRRTADWNDALTGGRLGKGESVMVAHQLAYTIKILIPVLEKIGEKELIKKYQLIYDRVKNTLNKDFWDGAWYIRATTDDGGPIGSKKNKEGKIDINAQTWSVLSGVGHFKGRDKKAMDSAWEHLNTKYGPAMFLPAYHLPSETFGIVSQFTPGTKENGAIFNHPVTWAIIAECLLGRGDKAYKYWQETSPVLRGEDPDLYKVEPYVYAEFIYGPDHPQFGRGSFTWTTGSASWYWRACLDYIIGLQPTLDGLKVEPCLPKVWTKVKVERDFRGSRYLIEINNPQKVNKGVKSIIVDDKKIKGNILPLFPNGEHQVIVEMGK